MGAVFRYLLIGIVHFGLLFANVGSASIEKVDERHGQSSVVNLENQSRSDLRCWHPMGGNCVSGFGSVRLGLNRELYLSIGFSIHDGVFFGDSVQTGALSYYGSSDFQITYDTCSSRVLQWEPDPLNGGYFSPGCVIGVKFAPTSTGAKNMNLSLQWSVCSSGGGSCANGGTRQYTATGFGVEAPPRCEYTSYGSIIKVDGQSLLERIPIEGTALFLSYSSAHSSAYGGVTTPLGIVDVFNPHGWTVSIHHYYDTDQRKVYFGDGSVQKRGAVTAGSNFVVASPSGDEVYVFGSDGRHLETKYGLTGATKYVFSYSSGSRLNKIEDAFGNETLFNRDSNDNLTSITAPRGQTTLMWRNSSNLLSLVESPNSEKYELTYKTGTTLLETYKKPGGQISNFTYDSTGRLIKDEGPGGDYWELTRTASGSNITLTKTSKMGRQTTVQILNGGQVYYRVETLPNGATRSYQDGFFDESITHTSEFRQREIEFKPDERFGEIHRRPWRETVTTNNNSSIYIYDQSITYPTGETPNFFNFETVSKTETRGARVHTSEFDANTKTTTFTSHEGAVNITTIDNYERPVETKVGSDTPWTYTYDSYGRLQEVSQGGRNKRTYTYNANGYVSKFTNSLNEETQFSYDLAGRVTQVTLPDSRVISYSYDANGNVTGITPPGRPQHGFTFNLMELLDTYQPPSIGVGITKDTTYTYNDDKQLTTITRPDGKTITFNYDTTSGLLNSITTPGGDYILAYTPNSDRIIGKRSPDGIRAGFTYSGALLETESQVRASDNFLFGKVTYGYDGDHRRISRTVQGNSPSVTSTINYTLNGDDVPTQVGDLILTYSYPSGRLASTSIGQISDARTYDTYGNLESYSAIYTPSGGGSPVTLYSYNLSRDLESRIIGKTETIQGVTSTYEYTYDSAGRLSTVKKDNVLTDSFTYDSNSNRISGMINGTTFTATYDDQDRLLSLGTRTYTYNENGDLTKIQWNAIQATDFVYDVMGNLKEVTLPSGDVIKYFVDGMDRRVVKQVNNVFQWRYLYEGQYRVAAQLNGMHAVQKEFVYATRINVPDYMIVGGNKFRIITDHLGSPRLVVRVDNGNVAQRMDYTVLGAVTNDTNPNFQPFGFAGGIYDNGTQLVRFDARDYDPRATGRWTTKDPIRFDGGDTNLYGYVLNDPVNFVDPSGLVAPLVVSVGLNFVLAGQLSQLGLLPGYNKALHKLNELLMEGFNTIGLILRRHFDPEIERLRQDEKKFLEYLDHQNRKDPVCN